MKANPNTGELNLPSGTILSPQLTRSMFLISVEGTLAIVSVENEPWCSFRFEDSEDQLGIIVFFKGEKLESVQFASIDPKFSASWNDWSEEKEEERKKRNNQWLMRNDLIPGKEYLWGSVWSNFDGKSGSSEIVLRYKNDS